MKTKYLFALSCLALLISNTALANCAENVDKIEIHYINGMFTDYTEYLDNLDEIGYFLEAYFSIWNFDYNLSGTYNFSEEALDQILQVARHKLQDAESTVQLAILQFLNNDPEYLDQPDAIEAVANFLQSIRAVYEGILAEHDTAKAKGRLVELLDSCARVVLLTHSQGNFYGNALFNDLYSSYSFPKGYLLSQHPMLGNMQIASPVYIPGGGAATLYPDAVGHVTNTNDLVIALVRANTGAVAANYDASFNNADLSGHGLQLSYLQQPGQASAIAAEMSRIVYSFTPYPLHEQYAASSTALRGYGYSEISQFLDLQFSSGSVYRYADVPQEVRGGLETASSQGAYFNQYIRDMYSYTRIK